MDLEELRRRLDAVREGLRHLASEDTLDEQRSTEFDWLFAEERWLADQVDNLERREERRQDVLRRAAEGAAGAEHGDDRGPGGDGSGTRREEDPFDLSTMRTSAVVDGRERHTAELRARARSAIERAQFPAEIGLTEDEQRARVARLLERVDTEDGAFARHVLLTGSPEYERAYGAQLLGRSVTDEGRRLLERAMTLGTGSEGGFAVMPFTLDPTIILTTDGAVNPIRDISRVESGVTNSWKGVSAAGVTATYAAELAEVPDSTPALDDPTVNAHRAHAFVPFSYELDQDWPGLRRAITALLQEAKDDLEADKFLNGAGDVANEPEGLLTGLTAAQAVATAGAEATTVADLYALEEALGPRFRTRARILGQRGVFNAVRQFDTQGGAALWERIGAATPAQLIGYPIHEVSGMDADVTAAGGKVLIIGDFRHYLIYDRIGMSLELIPQVFGPNGRPTGQRGVYAFWRNGAGVLVDNAFRYLEVTAPAAP